MAKGPSPEDAIKEAEKSSSNPGTSEPSSAAAARGRVAKEGGGAHISTQD